LAFSWLFSVFSTKGENMEQSIITELLNSLVSSMDNPSKKYGFNLTKISSNKFKSGFQYSVRYKDFDTNKWLPLRKITNTDNEEMAIIFAIDNRNSIIENYTKKKQIRDSNTNLTDFYKMLETYYTENSSYLEDDSINNKRKVTAVALVANRNFIKNYFIPFLQERNIHAPKEITSKIYTDFKLHLQQKNLATKSVNSYLGIVNRVLQNFMRNEIIEKLPYSTGGGSIRITAQEKAQARKPNLLPIEKLKHCFDYEVKDLFPYLLAMIGLTTGMRNSEIGRIKKEDLMYLESENIYLLKAYNNKTKFYNTTETDEYRKIPLHPFVAKYLIEFAKSKNQDDYLFGDENGNIHQKKFHREIIQFYKNINNMTSKSKDISKELQDKVISFYSFRHTFNTLCVLYRFNDSNIDRTDDIIDYFTGHKISNKMRANYTHINKVDNDIFYQNYEKFVIEVLDKFVFADE
jgi:integrase